MGFGPDKFEAKGTLNDKLTVESPCECGDMELEAKARLLGGRVREGSPLGLDISEGVIFSRFCRAWPMVLLNFCIVGAAAHSLQNRQQVGEREEEGIRCG